MIVFQQFMSVFRHSFVKSASALVSGTAIAQLIAMGALPFLTRLYTPDDFNVLAIYLSILSIVSVIACLRLEIAIPIPNSDSMAANLLVLSLFFAALIALIVGACVWLLTNNILEIFGGEFNRYAWLLAPGVWLMGSFSALQYWSARKKRFKLIAVNQIAQAGTGVGTQVAIGSTGGGVFGLLFGHLLYSGAGALGLSYKTIHSDRECFKGLNRSSLFSALKHYKNYPKYSTFEALFNSASIQLPVILIAAYAVRPEAGFLLLAMRILGAPLQLVGNAVAQVYLSRASEELHNGNLKDFTFSIMRVLAKISILPLTLFALIAPHFFAFVFGEEWRKAGVLVQWMTPWFILQFIVSPVSMALHLLRLQKLALFLQLVGLLIRVGLLLIASFFIVGYLSEIYAVSGFIFYGIYLVTVIYCVKNKNL